MSASSRSVASCGARTSSSRSTIARIRSFWPGHRPRSTGSSVASATRISPWKYFPLSGPITRPASSSVLGPIAEFFARSTFRPPSVPIYSCATHVRMPDDPEAIRQLAIAQWTRTVAFRETIETMHADGLRLFIDVGARGNLAGFVEDILRGKPAFAIAANLPRRGGLTQLNHLVAATFAQGASLNTDYLYTRRRPSADRLERDRTTRPDNGRAENRLSRNAVIAGSDRAASSRNGGSRCRLRRMPANRTGRRTDTHRLRRRPFAAEWIGTSTRGTTGYREFRIAIRGRDPAGRLPEWSPASRSSIRTGDADATTPCCIFQETMQAFLQTQQEVMAAYLGAA